MRFFILIVVILNLIACQSARVAARSYTAAAPPATADFQALAAAVRELGPEVSAREAKILAKMALKSVEEARRRHRMGGGAIPRNLAVNLGLAEWGLCWHWTEWLGRPLAARRFRTLELRWGCAFRGSPWREHNAVVVTARGQPFNKGLVLDPWRKSGRLTWVPVHGDRFPWEHDLAAEARWRGE